MSTLTISLPDTLKSFARERAKQEGVTLTFVVQKLLKAYHEGQFTFGLQFHGDEAVTKSFDVSSLQGKKDCIDDFKSLIQ